MPLLARKKRWKDAMWKIYFNLTWLPGVAKDFKRGLDRLVSFVSVYGLLVAAHVHTI